VVESLVLSNLLGIDSHGVVRIRNYFDSIQAGAIVPNAEPELVRDSKAVALMDGRKAFGQIVAKKAMKLAVQKAREYVIGAISFTDVYHIGRLGEYAAMAAEEGLIGLIIANGSRPGGLVAPFGSRERMLGTNPIAFAIPAGSLPPLVADFSTSSVAEGRVRIAMRKGRKVPPGWLIDREGKPTTEPGDLYEGGAILAFGEHKGYALSLLVEVVGGILSGADTPIFPNYKYMHNGVLVLVINPAFFRPEAEYKSAVDFLFNRVKQALPAQGMNGALIPVEPELKLKAIREKEGIPIDEETWAELLELAAALKVSIADTTLPLAVSQRKE
jgi:uncharacterized oxidoreductase